MGAGCNYTLEEDSDIRAYWVDVEPVVEDDNEFADGEIQQLHYEAVLDSLVEHILALPICATYGRVFERRNREDVMCDNKIYYGESYIVHLKSNYNGDGIVIDFEYQDQYAEGGLIEHNYSRSYHKLIRHINKVFELSIATSGWTSASIGVGEVTC